MKTYHFNIQEAINSVSRSYYTAQYRDQQLLAGIVSELSGHGLISNQRSLENMLTTSTNSVAMIDSSYNKNNDAAEDMWLSIRKYRFSIIEYIQQMNLLHRTSMICNKLRQTLASRIRMLFVVTMQLFSHERIRMWSESGEFLKSRCDNIIQWNAKLAETLKISMRVKENASPDQLDSLASSTDEGEGYDLMLPFKVIITDWCVGALVGDDTIVSELEKVLDSTDSMSPLTNSPSTGDATTPPASLIATSALPTGSNLVSLQSIMQMVSSEDAQQILDESKSMQAKQDAISSMVAVKVMATTDGVMHIFVVDNGTKRDVNPFKSILFKVLLLTCLYLPSWDDELIYHVIFL